MSDDPMAVAIQRIEFLQHRCDMEAEHVAELKEQLRASADQCRAQHQEIAALKAERDQLRLERDEARRWFCQRVEWLDGGDGTQEANGRGWDCFRESPLDRLARMDEENGL